MPIDLTVDGGYLEASLEIENAGDENDIGLEFNFVIKGKHFSYSFGVSNDISHEKLWKEMNVALEDGQDYKIDYENSNGEIKICLKERQVLFTIAKYGGDGAGSCTFTVEAKYCVDVFTQAEKAFRK